MENLPENWKIVEFYDGTFIFEDELQEFCVTTDFTENMDPPYEIWYNQLKGTFTRIGIENGGYSIHAFDENQAIERSIEMMNLINKAKGEMIS